MLTSKFSTLTGLFFCLLIVLGSPDSIAGQKSFRAKDVEMMPPIVMQLSPCAKGKESGLPLPSTFLPNRLPDFQAQVKEFLVAGRYKNLTWCEDKGLRDTGPFVNGVSYGTHPTVKIYYSPAVVKWLMRKNPDEVIPDGAMIVKEQYQPPAARYRIPTSPAKLTGWTIMIKDSKGSNDGWYWGEFWDTQCLDNNEPPFAIPYAGFGL